MSELVFMGPITELVEQPSGDSSKPAKAKAAYESELRSIKKEAARQSRELEHIQTALGKGGYAKIMDDLKSRVNAMSRLLQREITKTTTLTELRYLYRDYPEQQAIALRGAVLAMDYGDKWWDDRRNAPLYELAEACMTVARVYAADDNRHPALTLEQMALYGEKRGGDTTGDSEQDDE